MARFQPTDFVHLHVHSEYSMLDGLCKLPELVERVKEHGQSAIALTDHGAMYGTLHFFNTCQKAGIKPIIGLEAYIAKNSRFDKQVKMGSDQAHLTLLAYNLAGYHNLLRLTSAAHLEGFSYKPRIDDELLAQYHEGLILLTGCPSSPVNRLLRADELEAARAKLDFYKQVFGDRVYVEIQAHPNQDFVKELTTKQIKLARDLNLPLVATNDVHYINVDDAVAQDALLAVQTRKLLSDEKRMSMMSTPDLFLRSSQEMIELFADYPEAISNTVAIAEQCNVTIPTGQLIFPEYEIPKGETTESLLQKMAYEGCTKKFGTLTPELKTRLDYELEIINTKGYATYFLITQDFVNWAKSQRIGVGPGRGSAAGSLVSYSLNITSIDPLEHGLAFERFLNPQRPTPPDIDMDFADDRRDEVIRYVADKYGDDHVGHVITFGRMEARVAIRDIGRVMGLPYEDPDKIAKLIPNQPGHRTSLKQAVETVPELKAYYQQPKFRELIDLAQKVEGNVRHSSIHAAAIVITDKPLTEYVPIQRDSTSGKILTQYDMYALDCNIADDAIGLLKFDFLGLRNLSTIQTAVDLIKENSHKTIDIETIPLTDKKTYELLSKGDTMGVFQLESAGMRRVARSLQPNQFSDITAMVALFRPGPMDLIPQFIEGKHKPETIQYPDPSLIPILKETYGVMVYQEQILAIANTMAGYSLGEADILRRAIGKKKKKLLDENRKRFIDQSIAKGYSTAVAEKVWGFIEAFANYGFNKAHAASYAMIAYQTAYLKANYPIEYMAALMSIESASHAQNRDEKVALAIEESKSMGIHLLPPDINASHSDFGIEKSKGSVGGMGIRFGFSAIKHVGTAAIENLLETRERVGSFTSLSQCIKETDGRKVNKTTLECLIKVGAMDAFGTRAAMLENLEEIRKKVTALSSDTEGQDNLFAGVADSTTVITDTFPQVPEYPQQELLSFEKELLGLYLTNHPMAHALKAVEKQANKKIADIDHSIHQNQTFTLGGVLTQLRSVQTKATGKAMAFGTLEDASGKIRIVIFPRTFDQYQHLLKTDNVLIVKGRVDYRDEELQLVVEKIAAPSDVALTHSASDLHHELFIPRNTSKETLDQLGKLLKSSPGPDTVVVLIPNGSQPERMLLPYTVAWNEALETQVKTLLQTTSFPSS